MVLQEGDVDGNYEVVSQYARPPTRESLSDYQARFAFPDGEQAPPGTLCMISTSRLYDGVESAASQFQVESASSADDVESGNAESIAITTVGDESIAVLYPSEPLPGCGEGEDSIDLLSVVFRRQNVVNLVAIWALEGSGSPEQLADLAMKQLARTDAVLKGD